jgi:ABC-type lipoprotein export system ATPase subunit/ABC-type antimicrobial peptide transport system permease subunit
MPESIRLSNLGRQFQRGDMVVQALDGVDLRINEGEFVALVGPSGSGKSTMLNLLGGLDHPSSGELWVGDVDLHAAGEAERMDHRRHRVGFIFQSFNLLPRLTALENVAVPLMLAGVGKSEREARAAEMLQQVGLGHRLEHYPAEMSGGEQQRTAVARALIHKPALVLADEPTGNLDSKTGAEVMNLLRALNREQGITLIVVTHDADVAAYASRTVHLRDGRIVDVTMKETPVNEQMEETQESLAAKGRQRLQAADILQNALRNLGRRPVRNILTAGGVLIGIITLVAMVSFGVGVQREVQRNFDTIGLENIFVRPRFAEGDGFDPFADFEVVTPLTPDVVAAIAAKPQVSSVTPNLSLPQGMDIVLSVGQQSQQVRVADTGFGEARFGFGRSNEMIAGSDFDDQQAEGVVLIAGLADRLMAEGQTYADLIGQPAIFTLTLPRGETEDFPSTIIGVRDSFGRRTVDVGLAEREAMKAWWFGQPDIVASEGYDSLVVRARDLDEVPGLIEDIEALDLNTQSLEAVLDVANQVLTLLQVLLGSVGGLALLVAALGVANTMMMAIYERTREIGVLKALGASRAEIRALFTVEAALIGLIGGFFGLIFGTLLGRLVDWIAHRYLINEGVTGVGDLSIVPAWLAIGALIFAALIGLLAGLYPAARAARLDPVAALRHE